MISKSYSIVLAVVMAFIIAVIIYSIVVPIYLDYTIESNYLENKNDFEKLVSFYRTLSLMDIYFHSKDKIDFGMRTEADNYYEAKDIDVNSPYAIKAFTEANISKEQLQKLYTLLEKVNSKSIGMSAFVYRDNTEYVEVTYYRSFWYHGWYYLFSPQPVKESYIQHNSSFSDSYHAINDSVGWGRAN